VEIFKAVVGEVSFCDSVEVDALEDCTPTQKEEELRLG